MVVRWPKGPGLMCGINDLRSPNPASAKVQPLLRTIDDGDHRRSNRERPPTCHARAEPLLLPLTGNARSTVQASTWVWGNANTSSACAAKQDSLPLTANWANSFRIDSEWPRRSAKGALRVPVGWRKGLKCAPNTGIRPSMR